MKKKAGLMFLGIVLSVIAIGCATTTDTSTTTSTTSSTTTTTITTTTTTTTTSSSTTTTAFSYPTATLTHAGFDFATGTTTDEAGKYDGEVINWNPDYPAETSGYSSYAGYVWWRGANPLDAGPHQKHMGTVALNTITTVPNTWHSSSELIPLLACHSYVVKCTPEGYAKFYVTEAGTNEPTGHDWYAYVQYYYTTEAVFDR